MTRVERLLSQYAAYHLDRKNVMTHFIGVPLIVFSIICLTARVSLMMSGFEVTLALGLLIVSILYYLTIDVFFA
ncbi:Mpo1-like protein, partial [Acinetobacter variabilis]